MNWISINQQFSLDEVLHNGSLIRLLSYSSIKWMMPKGEDGIISLERLLSWEDSKPDYFISDNWIHFLINNS